MNGYLLGTTTVNGRTYTYNDVDGICETGFGESYYGGRVKKFGKTKEGFLLCIEKASVIDIFVNEESLTSEGKKLLEAYKNNEIVEADEVDTMDRKELLAKAKELGVEGKLAILKTEELREKVIEKLREVEA